MEQFKDRKSDIKTLKIMDESGENVVESHTVEIVQEDEIQDQGTPLNAETFNQLLQEINETLFVGEEFSNTSIGHTGSVLTYTVKVAGTYKIIAAGAKGGKGAGANNNFVGGNGAIVEANFELKKGDQLVILVGQKGGDSNHLDALSGDYTGGGGGGGTFVFRKIDSINPNYKYNFEKDEIAYEVLLVAAGGGGSSDAAYRTGASGQAGNASPIITPQNYENPSTTVFNGTTSNSFTNGGSIQQFITYDGVGNKYTRNDSTVYGGYGGGAVADDAACNGGGWSNKTNNGVSLMTSWSLDENAKGTTGGNTKDHGYCIIAHYARAKINFENNTLYIDTEDRWH